MDDIPRPSDRTTTGKDHHCGPQRASVRQRRVFRIRFGAFLELAESAGTEHPGRCPIIRRLRIAGRPFFFDPQADCGNQHDGTLFFIKSAILTRCAADERLARDLSPGQFGRATHPIPRAPLSLAAGGPLLSTGDDRDHRRKVRGAIGIWTCAPSCRSDSQVGQYRTRPGTRRYAALLSHCSRRSGENRTCPAFNRCPQS